MPSGGKVMRIAALLVALFTIVVGIVGIVSPDSGMTLRRLYYTPGGLYAGGAVRVASVLSQIIIYRYPQSLYTGTCPVQPQRLS
ncbi:MAG TPA: hypothetical protein VGL91_23660 [Acidobacteriota bacterium]